MTVKQCKPCVAKPYESKSDRLFILLGTGQRSRPVQSQTMSRRDPSRDAAHISHEQGHRQILVHNRQEGIHRGDHRTNNIILQIKMCKLIPNLKWKAI